MRLVVKKTNNLNKSQIKDICKLKDIHWKFGLKEQLIWFKKNVFENDLHFIVYKNKELAGYTLLRLRNYNYIQNKKKIKKLKKYFLFDTHIVKSKYRKTGMNILLMRKISTKIIKKRTIGFLLCTKSLLNYYKKFDWVLLRKNNVKIYNFKTRKSCMIFNAKKTITN